jgi:proline dehydrogenase
MSTHNPNILELLAKMSEAFSKVGAAYQAYLEAVQKALDAASAVESATSCIIKQPHIEIGPSNEMDG